MTILSQRDTKWKDIRIGESKSTIGDYGCTLTCIAMLAGLTPVEVNERLKRVKGFQDDLIIWSKIDEAIPWLKFVKRSKVYSNDEVRGAIEKNKACLVEVDFDNKISSPSDSHWVLYVGNQKMYDVWTGVEKSTTYYPILKGYAVIDVVANPPQDVPQEPTVTDKTKIDMGEFGIMEVQAIKSKLKDQIRDLETAGNTIANLNETIEGQNVQMTGLQKEVQIYKSQQEEYSRVLNCENNHPSILSEITKLIHKEDQQNGADFQLFQAFMNLVKNLFKKGGEK